jgi:transposase-like protein
LVSYETVRRWVNHFGPVIAADLRKRRPKPHMTWHLDECERARSKLGVPYAVWAHGHS